MNQQLYQDCRAMQTVSQLVYVSLTDFLDFTMNAWALVVHC